MANRKAISVATTHHIRDTCLCLHAQRAARSLARHFDEALGPLGLTSGQFSLLNVLNRPNPAPLGRVAEFLAMDRTTLTANLKPLERRRLVAIAVDKADRRSRLATLTPSGHALLAKAVPLWERAQAGIEARLAQPGPNRVRADLRALSRSPPSAPAAGRS